MRAALPQSSLSPWPLRGVIVSFLLAAALLPVSRAQSVSFAGATPSVNFGTANVCSAGQTTPAPCSQSMTLTYNVTASGTLGTPKALTTGAPNLDYTLASGSTCTGSETLGNTCTVNVTFAPTQPGARNGAVEIVDTSGNILATAFIYGTGVAPRIGFNPPSAPTTIGGTNFSTALAGATINTLAVDGNGNIFLGIFEIGGTPGFVIELLAVNGTVPANPVAKILPTVGNAPYDISAVAIDGAGNLFYAAYAFFGGGGVYEMSAADDYTTPIQINIIGQASNNPDSLAVDGNGNLFVAFYGVNPNDGGSLPGALYEVLAAGGYTTSRMIGGAIPASFNHAYGNIVLDATGNLFVSSGGILELSPSDGYNASRTINAVSGYLVGPDPAGNMFVSGPNSIVTEYFAVDGVLPANPASSSFAPPNLQSPLTLDARGNFYSVSASGLLQQQQLTAPPSPLPFPQTIIGQTSPQSVQIQNEGNATLALTGLSLDGSNWDLASGSGDCTASSSLESGVLCNVGLSFKPAEAGPLTGTVTFTDNTLNVGGAQQSILLSGVGDTVPPPAISRLSVNYGAPTAQVVITGKNFGATQGSSTVSFNGATATSCSWSNTSICVTVPALGSTGNLIVQVGGENSDPVLFTVLPTPVITGLSPAAGPAGVTVIINGSDLEDFGENLKLTYNGTLVFAHYDTNTAIQTSLPGRGRDRTLPGHHQRRHRELRQPSPSAPLKYRASAPITVHRVRLSPSMELTSARAATAGTESTLTGCRWVVNSSFPGPTTRSSSSSLEAQPPVTSP